jgi:hypothetical protein
MLKNKRDIEGVPIPRQPDLAFSCHLCKERTSIEISPYHAFAIQCWNCNAVYFINLHFSQVNVHRGEKVGIEFEEKK